jgi:hypothetical protein
MDDIDAAVLGMIVLIAMMAALNLFGIGILFVGDSSAALSARHNHSEFGRTISNFFLNLDFRCSIFSF